MLVVKTLKSFGDVFHSVIWEVKFIDGLESHFSIKDSYRFVVYHCYLNEKVGLVQLALQATFQFSSKHRSLAGLKAVAISSLQALLRVKSCIIMRYGPLDVST